MSKVSFDRSQFIMMFFAFAFGMILSNLLGQQDVRPEVQSNEILFTYKGIDKTSEDVSSFINDELDALAKMRYAILERAALQQYLYDYAEAEQLDLQLAGERLFMLQEPSEQEISDFFTQNAEKIQKPFFEVKADIKKQLILNMARQSKEKVLKELLARGDLVIF